MEAWLLVANQEKDCGGYAMKILIPCVAAMKTTNSIFDIIRKGTENKITTITMVLTKSMMQSCLEYCL